MPRLSKIDFTAEFLNPNWFYREYSIIFCLGLQRNVELLNLSIFGPDKMFVFDFRREQLLKFKWGHLQGKSKHSVSSWRDEEPNQLPQNRAAELVVLVPDKTKGDQEGIEDFF